MFRASWAPLYSKGPCAVTSGFHPSRVAPKRSANATASSKTTYQVRLATRQASTTPSAATTAPGRPVCSDTQWSACPVQVRRGVSERADEILDGRRPGRRSVETRGAGAGRRSPGSPTRFDHYLRRLAQLYPRARTRRGPGTDSFDRDAEDGFCARRVAALTGEVEMPDVSSAELAQASEVLIRSALRLRGGQRFVVVSDAESASDRRGARRTKRRHSARS